MPHALSPGDWCWNPWNPGNCSPAVLLSLTCWPVDSQSSSDRRSALEYRANDYAGGLHRCSRATRPRPRPGNHAVHRGLEQVYANIQNNPTARPTCWGESAVAGGGQYELNLCDNGMLIHQWTVNWGDGSRTATSFKSTVCRPSLRGWRQSIHDHRHCFQPRWHVHRRHGRYARRIGPGFRWQWRRSHNEPVVSRP